MHNVFISYHHHNDQLYKTHLLALNKLHGLFVDSSVDTGDITDDLNDEAIRSKIRDDYLKDSSVTIVLVGTETKRRKHIDWEIYSSMFDGKVNKKSGILVINLPSTSCNCCTAAHSKERETIYPEAMDWFVVDNRAEYERLYPFMPARIIDNLLCKEVKISVVNWPKVQNNPHVLNFLIEATFNDRTGCVYDLKRPMKRADS